MKLNKLVVMGAVTIFVSCSNDNDFFPLVENDCSWETTLDEIVTDNESLFENQGIKITGMRFVDGIKVNRDLFYGEEYGFFPVYSKKDSVFTVITYNELVNHSDQYSFDTISVNKTITRLLEKAEDYDVVELSWNCLGETYNSLALFNRRTGELEYDNMLFNMSTISRYERESFSRAIFITETGVYETGSDCVEYKRLNQVIAKSGVNWVVKGTWHRQLDLLFEDDVNYYYDVCSTFSMDRVEITPITFECPGYDVDVFCDYVDYSVSQSSTYNFRYAIWAGPNGGLDITSNNFGNAYHISEAPATFAARISSGNGRLVGKVKILAPVLDYWIVPKH